MSRIAATKQWLTNSHILVPDDWLQACVDWIEEENQGLAPAQDVLNSLVYEQWLLSDLRELETQCLPAEAVSETKFELNGAYALQIDSILDVGKSFYSQQQKCKGTENANTRVSAEEPEVKPWEMKPTRMLKVALTDGKQSIQGMEYRPIASLSPQTPSGSKILVHGSIVCRHGILMLSETCIKFLGGEVDTLVEANTILNTLQAAMDSSVEHAAKHHRQEFRGSEIIHSQKPPGSQLQPRPSQLTQQQQQPWQTSRAPKQEVRSQTHNTVKAEIRSQTVNGAQNRTANANANLGDQWDDDDDAELMDAFMDDMDMDDFDQPTVQQPGTSRNMQAPARNTGGTSRENNWTGSNNFRQPEEGCRVDRNENNRPSLSRNLDNANNSKKSKAGPQNKITGMTGSENHNSNNRNSFQENSNRNARNNQAANNDFEDDMDFDEDMDFPPMEDNTVNVRPVSARNVTNSSTADQLAVRPRSGSSSLHRNKHNPEDGGSASRQTPRLQDSVYMETSSELDPTTSSVDNTAAVKAVTRTNEIHQPVGSVTAAVQGRNVSRQSAVTQRENSAGSAEYRNIKKESKTDESTSDTYIQDEYPFTYIAKVMALPKQEASTVHTVKAYISTLISRLSSDMGKWTLACKINDGTMAIDVDISDQVLRLKAKQDPRIKDMLKKGIQDFQNKLVNLMCLLEIQVAPGLGRPVVVATKPVSPNHIEMLHNRVMASWGKFGQS